MGQSPRCVDRETEAMCRASDPDSRVGPLPPPGVTICRNKRNSQPAAEGPLSLEGRAVPELSGSLGSVCEMLWFNSIVISEDGRELRSSIWGLLYNSKYDLCACPSAAPLCRWPLMLPIPRRVDLVMPTLHSRSLRFREIRLLKPHGSRWWGRTHKKAYYSTLQKKKKKTSLLLSESPLKLQT